VTIDGKPAGVAPVYPWYLYRRHRPFLWEPIPGVQTLDFRPYRVDLYALRRPAAGRPQSPCARIGVYNADSYFLATANLLAYTDRGRARASAAGC